VARSGTCPSCSAKLSRHASYCPGCGRTLGVDLDLSALDDDDEPLDERSAPPERSHRTRNLVVGVGLAVALIGGAVLVSRDDATTAEVTEGTTTSSSEPRRTTGTTRTPRTTLPRPTTSVYLELVPKGPLLPEPTGTVLYGTTSDRQLVRIDLDTGAIALRRLPESTDEGPIQLLPRQGAIVVGGYFGSPGFVVPLDLQGEVTELPVQGHQLLRGPEPDELWRVTNNFSPSQLRPRAQRMKLDGTLVGPEVELPLQVYTEDGTGRLVGAAPLGQYVFTPDGQPSLLSDGQIVAMDSRYIVDVICDEVLDCHWRVRDRAESAGGSAGRLLEVAPDLDLLMAGATGTLSPDGRWVALFDGLGAFQLLDLTSGALQRVSGTGAPGIYVFGGSAVWSPDSQWLFWSDAGNLRAWKLGWSEPMRIGGGSTPSLDIVVGIPA
jgi:hypothetical protein